MHVSFYTLGCKLNQSESEALAGTFVESGLRTGPLSGKADILVVNTCTVTSKSEQKARRVIRKFARENPASLIIITGCYAQLDEGGLSDMDPAAIVVPMDTKHLLMELPEIITSHTDIDDQLEAVKEFLVLGAGGHKSRSQNRFRFFNEIQTFHSRAFLKIQDGCNNFCAYCRVPLARGHSVSLDPPAVIQRAHAFYQAGFHEIVITGVNICSYNAGGYDLADIVSKVLADVPGIRVRLSSIEPDRIDAKLRALFEHDRLCPHYHIPLQTASDKLLANMGRLYTSSEAMNAVQSLLEINKNAFLAYDIICGLPGETRQDFEQTSTFIEATKPAALHVFKYSPRPGTRAGRMPGQVPDAVKKERSSRLSQISGEYLEDFKRAQNGTIVRGLVETSKDQSQDQVALSQNYLRFKVVAGGELEARRVYPFRLTYDTKSGVLSGTGC